MMISYTQVLFLMIWFTIVYLVTKVRKLVNIFRWSTTKNDKYLQIYIAAKIWLRNSLVIRFQASLEKFNVHA